MPEGVGVDGPHPGTDAPRCPVVTGPGLGARPSTSAAPPPRPTAPRSPPPLPQHGAQADGVGFPQARLMALFGPAVGAVIDAAVGPSRGKQPGENALLRTLAGAAPAGAVLVAGRYFGSRSDLATWQSQHVDV